MWANGFEKLLEDPKGLQTFAVSITFRFLLFFISIVYYIHVIKLLNTIDSIQGVSQEGVQS